ncbi:MAG TPA: hypothetical protein PKN32_11840 [Bacteroidales bacterium]|nr:hypothetical protein [Bacteroidales bacterium]
MPTNKSYLIKLLVALTCISAILMFASCDKEDNEGQGTPEVMCTAIYQHISIKLKYPNGQPVLLDSSKVFWVSENRYLEKYSYYRKTNDGFGSYRIVNDDMQEELQNKMEVMHFTGYKNNKIIYERDVLVGADCCHVNYLGTEPLEVTIEY